MMILTLSRFYHSLIFDILDTMNTLTTDAICYTLHATHIIEPNITHYNKWNTGSS